MRRVGIILRGKSLRNATALGHTHVPAPAERGRVRSPAPLPRWPMADGGARGRCRALRGPA
eukprot:5533408-Prymnesium_polylepis.1